MKFSIFAILTALSLCAMAGGDECRDGVVTSARGIVVTECRGPDQGRRIINGKVVAQKNGGSWVFVDSEVITRNERDRDAQALNDLAAAATLADSSNKD